MPLSLTIKLFKDWKDCFNKCWNNCRLSFSFIYSISYLLGSDLCVHFCELADILMFWMVSEASLSWHGEWHLGITNSIELRPNSHSSPTFIHYHPCHLANTDKKKTHGSFQRVCSSFYSAVCILALCHSEAIQAVYEWICFFLHE